jgi:flagellar assembly protein FliH
MDESELEDEKLASFEAGFQAGWDDALKAQSDSNTRISTDLAKNLQDTSFSYHEARAALIKSLRPLFTDITNTLLPVVARESMGAHIVEQLTDMSRSTLDQVIEVTVAPNNVDAIEQLLNHALPEPFVLIGDDDLGEGQVFLRIGADEREIDLEQVVTSIAAAMETFFQHAQEDVKHD